MASFLEDFRLGLMGYRPLARAELPTTNYQLPRTERAKCVSARPFPPSNPSRDISSGIARTCNRLPAWRSLVGKGTAEHAGRLYRNGNSHTRDHSLRALARRRT